MRRETKVTLDIWGDHLIDRKNFRVHNEWMLYNGELYVTVTYTRLETEFPPLWRFWHKPQTKRTIITREVHEDCITFHDRFYFKCGE